MPKGYTNREAFQKLFRLLMYVHKHVNDVFMWPVHTHMHMIDTSPFTKDLILGKKPHQITIS